MLKAHRLKRDTNKLGDCRWFSQLSQSDRKSCKLCCEASKAKLCSSNAAQPLNARQFKQLGL